MSWIQENKVPAAILGVTGAGVIGLGVVLFNTWSAAGAAQKEYDTVNTSLASMKSAPLAPTPENLTAKQAQVKDYSDAVGKLSLVLYKLQPEDKPISNNDFQAKLKGKIAEIKKIGGSRLPAEFNLAFDQYTSELPKSDEVASELSTYLDSVDEIVKMLLKSGIRSMDMLERSPLPSEKGEPAKPQQASKAKAKGVASRTAAPAAVNITERRQVRVVIRADQGALQTLLSNLASPSEMPFFTVVRLLRIENEAKEGPPRVVAAATAPIVVDPAVPAPPNPSGAATAKPAPTGIQPAAPDSHVVLGKETLRAFLEIDLVKFVNPNTPAPATR
ncbi:MAG: Amuc_1100 family pilus-like protein [Prosthecobacter sp.]